MPYMGIEPTNQNVSSMRTAILERIDTFEVVYIYLNIHLKVGQSHTKFSIP